MNSSTKKVIWGIVIVLIIIGLYYYFSSTPPAPPSSNPSSPSGPTPTPPTPPVSCTVAGATSLGVAACSLVSFVNTFTADFNTLLTYITPSTATAPGSLNVLINQLQTGLSPASFNCLFPQGANCCTTVASSIPGLFATQFGLSTDPFYMGFYNNNKSTTISGVTNANYLYYWLISNVMGNGSIANVQQMLATAPTTVTYYSSLLVNIANVVSTGTDAVITQNMLTVLTTPIINIIQVYLNQLLNDYKLLVSALSSACSASACWITCMNNVGCTGSDVETFSGYVTNLATVIVPALISNLAAVNTDVSNIIQQCNIVYNLISPAS